MLKIALTLATVVNVEFIVAALFELVVAIDYYSYLRGQRWQ